MQFDPGMEYQAGWGDGNFGDPLTRSNGVPLVSNGGTAKEKKS